MKTESNDDLKKYLDLPYTVILKRDDEGDFVAQVKELRGCVAHGASASEALVELDSMKVLWLESCIADGNTVPLPETEDDLPSGRWLQRVPRQLHAELSRLADSEGVSLNQLVVSVLAKELGFRQGQKKEITNKQVAVVGSDLWSTGFGTGSKELRWQMPRSPTTEIGKVFIGQLVEALPQTTKSSVDIGSHEEKNKHSAWN
jgi:antitoxin HicB